MSYVCIVYVSDGGILFEGVGFDCICIYSFYYFSTVISLFLWFPAELIHHSIRHFETRVKTCDVSRNESNFRFSPSVCLKIEERIERERKRRRRTFQLGET